MKPIILGPLISLLIFSHLAQALPLYKIEKNGRVNYILATNHNILLRESELPKEIKDLVSQSRLILNEAGNLEQMNDLAAQLNVVNIVDDKKPVRNVYQGLSKQEQAEWTELLRQGQISVEKINTMAALPFYLSVYNFMKEYQFGFSVAMYLQIESRDKAAYAVVEQKFAKMMQDQGLTNDMNVGMGASGEPIDLTLTKFALRTGKKVEGLDRLQSTLDGWRSDFSGLSLTAYIRSVLNRVRGLHKASVDELLEQQVKTVRYMGSNLWRSYCMWNPALPPILTDLPATKSVPALYIPEFFRSLIGRHKQWMPQIKKEFTQGGVLLVVGVLHVIETPEYSRSTAILSLLKQEGYKVEFIGGSGCSWR